ncbi:hypothetical protein ACFX2I_026261 [Malus domestica]
MEGLGFPVRGGAKPRLQLCFPARGGAVATPRPHVASPLPARQGEREQSVSTWNQASSQELTAWNPLPDYLPGIALEYSSSTCYVSREDYASA